MLLIPKHIAQRQVAEEREGLVNVFNRKLETLINLNSNKDKFYVIGSLVFPDSGNVGKVLVESCDEKPPVIKGTFVYEVDNREGTKQLLWTCDQDNLNVVPTNKSFKVSPT